MGNKDEEKSAKSEKPASSVPTDQNKIQVYPNWAVMQAYYGPPVNMPPYYNSSVTSGHAPPPYMWGPPQHMMPPYGVPYATIYPHGGVYAHPAVPLASHGHGVPSSTAATTPVETPTKSSGNTELGLIKKLKGFDGLTISIGNGTAENAEGRAEPRPSQSMQTEGSTDGSDGNTTGTDQSRRKRSREGTSFIAGGDGKIEAKSNPVAAVEVTATVSPKPIRTVHCGVSDVWSQNERELIRERRKQSNRESARRSRLRKQVETEELARKAESLTSENTALRSEINQLTEKSEKLRLENATLEEGLKKAQRGHAQEIISNKKEDKEGEIYEENNSSAKLHQLLDPSPRADAVAAG